MRDAAVERRDNEKELSWQYFYFSQLWHIYQNITVSMNDILGQIMCAIATATALLSTKIIIYVYMHI